MSPELESVRALFRHVVDYAGTFPPAALALDGAARNYARHRSGDDSWMLNRFVVAARDLDELANSAPANAGWHLSVVCRDIDDIDHALSWQRELASIVSLETQLAVDTDREVYVERSLPVAREELSELKSRGVMLKIRLGGELTPSSAVIAQTLSSCAAIELALKATAGLHQAIRSGDHGFVNLILAATLARVGGTIAEIEALLDEDNAAAFAFEPDGVSWHAHRFDTSALVEGRRLLRSFGSCSFDEPVESLGALAR